MERIVIKVGSNVLTRSDGSMDITRMSSLVDQIAELRRSGYEVILVSSGAVACGRNMVRPEMELDTVEQRQLYSAVGQARLMDLYFSLFRNYNITVGQVLTMKESFSTEHQYQNQRQCMEVMLGSGVIPIVNENDTVCVTELMFTDNDELSGLVAQMMGASRLLILTNVDGVFDGDPSDSGSKLIEKVRPGEDLSSFIQEGRSSCGRGGMVSKAGISSKVAAAGITVIVANGKREGVIPGVLMHPADFPHTEFVA